MRAHIVGRLQRQHGNAAVQRLLQAHGAPGVIHRAVAAPPAAGESAATAPPVPDLETPETSAAEGLEATTAKIHSAPHEIEQSAGAPSGGGLLDTILDAAKSVFRGLVSTVTGLVSGAAGGVVSALSGAIGKAAEGVKGLGASIKGLVKGGLSGVMSTLTGAYTAVQQGIGNAIKGILGRASSLMSGLRGKLTQAVVNAIMGKSDILGTIQSTVGNAIKGVVGGIQGLFAGAVAKVSAALDLAVNGINSLADRVAGSITSGVDAAYNALTGVLDRASALLNGASSQAEQQGGGIGGLVRRAISSLTSRLFSIVRGIANKIIAMVRAALDKLRDSIKKLVEKIRQGVHKVTEWARNTAKSVATRVKNAVQGAIKGALALGGRMVAWAKKQVGDLFKAIIKPLTKMLEDKLAEYLVPMVQQMLREHPIPPTAPGLGPLGKGQLPPAPLPEAALATVAASASTLQVAAHDVLRGILKPDGDHFSIALTGMGNIGAGIGVGAGGGASLDLVFDYPSHQMGFFLSPQVFGQLSAGAELKGGPEADLTGSWGSVLSFGANRGKGVEEGYKGAFTNVGGGINAEEVIGATTGGNFYIGAWPWDIPGSLGGTVTAPSGTTTPGTTTPSTTTPGTTTPGTTTPGTETPGTKPIDVPAGAWDVFFATEQSDLSSAANGTLDAAVAALVARHAAQPAASFTVQVVAEASPRWRHPGKSTAAQQNQALSERRAAAVAAALNARLGGAGLAPFVTVRSTAIGSTSSSKLSISPDDNDQRFREAAVAAVEHDPATPPTTTPPTTTPGTTTPGTTTPGTTTPGTTTPGGPLPGAGPTIGWDSNMGVTLKDGVGASAFAQAGVSYSFFIGEKPFPPKSETPIRVLLGFSKMLLDVASLSPLGFLRDLLGTVGAFIPDGIVDKIVNFIIPVPGR